MQKSTHKKLRHTGWLFNIFNWRSFLSCASNSCPYLDVLAIISGSYSILFSLIFIALSIDKYCCYLPFIWPQFDKMSINRKGISNQSCPLSICILLTPDSSCLQIHPFLCFFLLLCPFLSSDQASSSSFAISAFPGCQRHFSNSPYPRLPSYLSSSSLCIIPTCTLFSSYLKKANLCLWTCCSHVHLLC